MAVMTRLHHPKQLQDGLNAVFGMEYSRQPNRWEKMFSVYTSNKAYEEDVLNFGFGGAAIKPEGGAVTYDQGGESWTARYLMVTIALAFALTEEMVEDGLYASYGERYSSALARSMKYTEEVRAHSILNNGFDSNFAGGDGKELFATDHPLSGGGTFANELSTPADLSEDAIEDACIAIRKFVDDRGLPVMTRPQCLFVPVDSEFIAKRVLQTPNAPGTANNDINAVKGVFPQGYGISEYLSDTNAWFIKTDTPHGLKKFNRRKLKKGMEGDFETGNLRYKATQRYAFGWTDPRGAFASAGAT